MDQPRSWHQRHGKPWGERWKKQPECVLQPAGNGSERSLPQWKSGRRARSCLAQGTGRCRAAEPCVLAGARWAPGSLFQCALKPLKPHKQRLLPSWSPGGCRDLPLPGNSTAAFAIPARTSLLAEPQPRRHQQGPRSCSSMGLFITVWSSMAKERTITWAAPP